MKDRLHAIFAGRPGAICPVRECGVGQAIVDPAQS
jgi:hypothetical protein